MAFPSLNSHQKLLAWRCSDLISLANTAQEEKYQTLMWGVNSKEWLPCGKVALGYAALQEACKKKFLIKRAPKEGLSKKMSTTAIYSGGNFSLSDIYLTIILLMEQS